MNKEDLNIESDNDGLEKATHYDPELLNKFKRKKLSVQEYIQGILKGDRFVLSQAITLIESKRADHQKMAEEIISTCLAHSSKSIRIGITGSPGVGKSTFIETFGKYLTDMGLKVAVLAVDPSSQITQGSILGDKTRMQELSNNPSAFIRPSAAGDSLGGVARNTRETIFLCEAAGFDCIIVETVGVGQSETAVHSMVDFFLLLLLPNAGDELQGIKRGVVEMADLIAVNKSDGPSLSMAKLAKAQYQNALHLFPPKPGNWIPSAELCSGITAMGIDLIWNKISEYKNSMKANGQWDIQRSEQAKNWMHETIQEHLKDLFYKNPGIEQKLPEIEKEVLEAKISSFKAAEILLKMFLGK